MITVLTEKKESLGYQALILRLSQKLTQQELANLADVSQREVYLFERNLPVNLDIRRRLLKVLWAKKVSTR